MSGVLGVLVWAAVTIGAGAFFVAHGPQLRRSPYAGRLGSWLTGRPAEDRGWAGAFLQWFDAIFRVRPVATRWGALMLPSFARSVLASLLALVVLAGLWLGGQPPMSLHGGGTVLGAQAGVLIVTYGLITLITNWIPDYLSLVESRFVLTRLVSARHPVVVLGWLVLDVVLSLGIALVAIYVAGRVALPILDGRINTLFVGCLSPARFSFDTAWAMFLSGLRFETPPATLNYDASGIYIYSTLLTSLWVWLFVCAGKLVSFAAVLFPAGVTQVGRRPGVFLGAAAAGLVGVGWFFVLQAVQGPGVDVYVVHGETEAGVGADVEQALTAAGWRVHSGTDLDDEALRSRGSAILVLEGAARSTRAAIAHAVACGERSSRSVVDVYAPVSPSRAVASVRRASFLLTRSQQAECQVRDRSPPRPTTCRPPHW